MIGNLTQFWRLTRELDLAALQRDFDLPHVPRILGTSLGAAESVAGMLGAEGTPGIQQVLLGEVDVPSIRAGGVPEIVLAVLDAAPDARGREALAALTASDRPYVLIRLPGAPEILMVGATEDRTLALDPTGDPTRASGMLASALARVAPDASLALGRRLPRLRPYLARRLIEDAARVNAQFAALSSLPAVLPLIGGLAGGAADLLVLTKNQVLLVFKLAGLHGRDLALGRDVLMEIAPVVGGAFLWRSAARSLAGMVPGPVGAVPKVLVAYTGTWAVGELARYYYEHGRKPPADHLRIIQTEALGAARRFLPGTNNQRNRHS